MLSAPVLELNCFKQPIAPPVRCSVFFPMQEIWSWIRKLDGIFTDVLMHFCCPPVIFLSERAWWGHEVTGGPWRIESIGRLVSLELN